MKDRHFRLERFALLVLAFLLARNANALCPAISDPPPPGYGAVFIEQSVPDTMIAGQTYPVWIRMANTGSVTWDPNASFRLSGLNPQDHDIWANQISFPNAVPAGREMYFLFNVTAPGAPGTYQWQ